MKIGIIGCAGRMGRMLTLEVLATDGCTLAGGTELEGSPTLGMDMGVLVASDPANAVIGDDVKSLFEASDAVIDFTTPDMSVASSALAAETGVPVIIGTTGLATGHLDEIRKAGERVAIVQAANMSVGVNLLLGLAEQVAGILGRDYDIEIVEMHHRHKVDAPSGTALAIGEAAAKGRNVDLESVSQRVRDGHTGPRRAGDIGFASLRGGDVVGDHSLIFAAEGERIEINHKASARTIYARGAVRAALWVHDKAPGVYSMRDVLGLA